MANKRHYRYFSCDFETTVYEGQDHTEVWASAVVELQSEDVKIFHSINETFEYFKSLDSNLICYYHNLKFDGNFWLWYLLYDTNLTQAYDPEAGAFVPEKNMKNNTYTYCISDMGEWYYIRIMYHNHIIELRDSLKLLPFSVREIGKAFKTKHQKLDMEYTGYRYAGCEITEEEQKYIKNDVLVVKEALETMFAEGHKRLTIGSCCLHEYKKLMSQFNTKFDDVFPQLYDYKLDKKLYDSDSAGEYIRRSYRGGWCYVVKGKEGKVYKNGITADVNSLYPSMMSSESGNRYPYGNPTFWSGNYIPKEAQDDKHYYFVRIRTRFYLKKGKLPFIQIKGSLLYKSTEMLESSDLYNPRTGGYSAYYIDFDGKTKLHRVTLTLTQTDFALVKDHYDLKDFEILDGCYFKASIGFFDTYIEKYKKIKLESTGARRSLAKLFLNNLYGKFATNQDSSFKLLSQSPDETISSTIISANDKLAGYIAIGSAITSYSRNFTIRTAQKNYYGADKPGFIYADTDSIHCDLPAKKLKGIKVDDKNFCCWKLESSWDKGIFVRQKTYIEHVTHENLKPIEEPYYNIKCAGMPEACKNLFVYSMTGTEPEPEKLKKLTDEQIEFIKTKRTIEDFKVGLKIFGKLMPKQIKGGVILEEGYYEMRPL